MTTNITYSNPINCLEDYIEIFGLSARDLTRKILECPAKISCFNAQMYSEGRDNVVSVSSDYAQSLSEMAESIDSTLKEAAKQANNPAISSHQRADQADKSLLSSWNPKAQVFLADYSRGLSCGRYQAVSERRLPFEDCHFDLALCADSMSGASKHSMLERITELCRVAQEVRLFPLLDRSGEIAEVFGPVMLAMQQANYGLEVKQVPDKKGQLETNAMLRIWAKACLVD